MNEGRVQAVEQDDEDSFSGSVSTSESQATSSNPGSPNGRRKKRTNIAKKRTNTATIVDASEVAAQEVAKQKALEDKRKQEEEGVLSAVRAEALTRQKREFAARGFEQKYTVTFSDHIFSTYNTTLNSEISTLSLLDVSSALCAENDEIDKIFKTSTDLYISRIERLEQNKEDKGIKIVIKERLSPSSVGNNIIGVNAGKTLTINLKSNNQLTEQNSKYLFKLNNEQALFFKAISRVSPLEKLLSNIKEYKEKTQFTSSVWEWAKKAGVRDDDVELAENIVNDYKQGKKSELKMLQELSGVRTTTTLSRSKVVEVRSDGKKIYDSRVWNMLDSCIESIQQQNQDSLIQALIRGISPLNHILSDIANTGDFVIAFGEGKKPELKEAVIFYLENLHADKINDVFYNKVKEICGYMRQSDKSLGDVEKLIQSKENILVPLYAKKWDVVAENLKKLVEIKDIESVENAVKEIEAYILSYRISSKDNIEELAKFAGQLREVVKQSTSFEQRISVAIDKASIEYLQSLMKAPTKDSKNVFLDILNGKSWFGDGLENKSSVIYAAGVFIRGCLDNYSFQSFEFLSGLKDNKNNVIFDSLLQASDGKLDGALEKATKAKLEELMSGEKTEEKINVLLEILNQKPLIVYGDKNWGNGEDLLEILCGLLAKLNPENPDDRVKNHYIISLLEKTVSVNFKISEPQRLVISKAVKIELDYLFEREDNEKIEEVLQRGYIFKIGGKEYGKRDEIQKALFKYVAKIGESQSDTKYRNVFHADWRKLYFDGLGQALVEAYHSPAHLKQYEDLLSAIVTIESGDIPHDISADLKQIALDFRSGLFIPAVKLKALKEKIEALKDTDKTSPYIASLLKAFVTRMDNSETEEEKITHDKLFAGYKKYLTSSHLILGFIESTITEENLIENKSEGRAYTSDHFEGLLSQLMDEMKAFLQSEFKDYVLNDFDVFTNKIIEKIKDYSSSHKILFAQRLIEFFSEMGQSGASIKAIAKLHVVCALGVSECRETEVNFMAALLKNDIAAIKEAYKKIEEEYQHSSDQQSIIERTSKILVQARKHNKELDFSAVLLDRESHGTEGSKEEITEFSECCAVKLYSKEIVKNYFSGKKSGNPLIDKFDEKTILRVIKKFPDMLSIKNNGDVELYSVFKDHLIDVLSKYPEIRAEQSQQVQSRSEVIDDRISPDKINFLCALYKCLNNTDQKLELQKIIEEYNFRAMNHIRKLTAFENMDKKDTDLNYQRNQNLFAVSMLLIKLKGDPQQINEVNSRNDALVCNSLKAESDTRDQNTAKVLWYSRPDAAKAPTQIKTEIAEKRKSTNIHPNMEFKHKAVSLTEDFRDFVLKQGSPLVEKYNQQVREQYRMLMQDIPEDSDELMKNNHLDKCLNILADYILKNDLKKLPQTEEELNRLIISNGDNVHAEKVKAAWNFVSSFGQDWFNSIKNSLEIRVQWLKILFLLSQGSYGDVVDCLNKLNDKISSMVKGTKGTKEFSVVSLMYLDFLEFESRLRCTLRSISKKRGNNIQVDIDWCMSEEVKNESRIEHAKNFPSQVSSFLTKMPDDSLLEFLRAAFNNSRGKEMKYLMALANNGEVCKEFSAKLEGIEESILTNLVITKSDNVELLKISNDLGVIRDFRLCLVERAVNVNVLDRGSLDSLRNRYVAAFNTRLKGLSQSLDEMEVEGDQQQDFKQHIEATVKMALAFLMSGGSYFQIKAIELLLGKFGFLQDSNTFFNECIEFFVLDKAAEKVKEVVGNKDELKVFYLKAVLKDSRRERFIDDPSINLSDEQERRNHFACIRKTIEQMISDDQLSGDIKSLMANLRDQQSKLENNTYGKMLWNECLNKIEGLKEMLRIIEPALVAVSTEVKKTQASPPMIPPRPPQNQSTTKTVGVLNSSPYVPEFNVNAQIFNRLQKINNESSEEVLLCISEYIRNSLRAASHDWQAKFCQLLLTKYEEVISSYKIRSFINDNVEKFKDTDGNEHKAGDGLRRFYLSAILEGVMNGSIKEDYLNENNLFIRRAYLDLKERAQLPKLFLLSVERRLKGSASGDNSAATLLLSQLDLLISKKNDYRDEVRGDVDVKKSGSGSSSGNSRLITRQF